MGWQFVPYWRVSMGVARSRDKRRKKKKREEEEMKKNQKLFSRLITCFFRVKNMQLVKYTKSFKMTQSIANINFQVVKF